MWEVRYGEQAAQERSTMPARERVALDQATANFAVLGPSLPPPQLCAGRQWITRTATEGRAKSPASPLRVGDVFAVLAVGPETQTSPREFERMVRVATQRMEKLSDEGT